MHIEVLETSQLLGQRAAGQAARRLNEALAKNGAARLVLSTGASQFATLDALVRQDVDWQRVEVFHLDEYIGIAPDHPASFVRYLRERVAGKLPLKAFHHVDVSRGAERIIDELTREIGLRPVDVGLIGIGENTHIAFNDPPADFETTASFQVVELNEDCRRQQLGEGWFPSLEAVPQKAISMTVSQIMKCGCVISPVPYAVKARAIHAMLAAKAVTPAIPATILKTHPDMWLFLDPDSAALTDEALLAANRDRPA